MSFRARLISPFLLLVAALLATGCPADDPDNRAPELTLDVRSEETYVVGEDIIRIQANATDPDGDDITWEAVNAPDRAEFQTFSNSALLTWDPITSDVTGGEPRRLIIAATDSFGNRTERVVNVTILAGNGVPRFISGSSHLYDSEGDGPVSFEVQVRDDDSSNVSLTMDSETAPAGASFERLDPGSGGIHRGEFKWTPTLQQRNTRIHSVTFVAEDGDNEPVTQQVSLIFQDNTGGNTDPDPTEECGADRPIEHDPLKAQRTLDPYLIEAEFINGAEQTWDIAYLFWSDADPLNDADVYESSEMKIDGKNIRGVIPNPALPAGESETIFYSICLGDNDAPEGSEDAFICVPSSTLWSFHAYSPDDAQCIDDTAGSDFSTAEPISSQAWSSFRACDGSPDMHTVTVPAGETAEVYVTYSSGSGVSVTGYDQEQKERDIVIDSDCLGISYLELTAGQADTTYYVEVEAADAPYQIRAYGQTGSSGCPDDEFEPNDTTSDAILIFEDEVDYPNMSVCEADDVDVYAWDMLVGDTALVETQFSHADGDIDMTMFAPSDRDNVEPDGLGVAEGWSTDDDEFIDYTAAESGVFHLAVFTQDEPNDYGFSFIRSCGDADAFGSSNHSRTSAALITPETYVDLKVCSGSPDWYERTGFADASVLAEVEIQQGARVSDVTFGVYDESGQLVKEATESNGRLNLDFTPSERGQYFYKVESDYSMVYSLTFLE
ncbi:MAG: hypothetical protein ACQEVA_18585 [Myxococcota bacterium]